MGFLGTVVSLFFTSLALFALIGKRDPPSFAKLRSVGGSLFDFVSLVEAIGFLMSLFSLLIFSGGD